MTVSSAAQHAYLVKNPSKAKAAVAGSFKISAAASTAPTPLGTSQTLKRTASAARLDDSGASGIVGMTSSTPMRGSDVVAEVQNDPKLDLSPDKQKMLDKAKCMFLDHLKQVDTSSGPVETVIIKFRLLPAMTSALEAFVEQYGCRMRTRIISREEQDKIDRRHKTCAQFTSVVVTPEAKKAYLPLASTHESPPETRKSSAETRKARPTAAAVSIGRKKTESNPTNTKTDRLITLPESGKAPTDKTSNHDADSNETESILKIPYSKFDDFVSRLANTLLLLPTTDPVRGTECRDALIEIAHEMRELREVKRSMEDDEKDGEKPRAAKKAKKSRV
ncbi:hypothetical protein B0H10DRAFT_2439061 [Mycena sp. CBHHK59/15]|nr:hypothetical protein B0H10DRAFT_2439061 [Mycena sp. CBHHK59/15]